MGELKVCSKCGLSKCRTEFHSKKSSADRLYPLCKACRAEYDREYNAKNEDRIKLQRGKYRTDNKEKIQQINKKYGEDNKERIRIKNKEYYLKNKAKIIKRVGQYDTKKMKEDPSYKMAKLLRHRLYMAVKGNFKAGSAVRDLGCSIKDFKKYVESLWRPGMSWENYGREGWHLDHIIPLVSFDLQERGQLLKACHYSNIQPLWAIDNLRKSSKLI